MSRFTISKKIAFAVIPVVLISLLIFGMTTYFYMSKLVREDLSTNVLKTVKEQSKMVDVWIKNHMLEVESIAQTPTAKKINDDFKAMDDLNKNRYTYLKKTYPLDYSDIYSAKSDGTYHTVQQKKVDNTLFCFEGNIKTRSYFKSIMAGGPAQITRPLISKTTGKPTIFMIAPIKNSEGIPQGLVGAGIQLNFITNTVKELMFGKGSYGIALASDGTILAHKDKSLVMKKKLGNLNSGQLSQLYDTMKSKGTGIFDYQDNGINKLAFYSTIPSTGWVIATIIT